MTNTLDVRKEQFKSECKLLNLKYEYEGYHGDEKWAIITELTEKELLEKYADEVKPYRPFVLLTAEQGEAIYKYRKNEDKFRKRRNNNEDIFGYDDDITERIHSEIIMPDFVEQQGLEELEQEQYQRKMELIDRAISALTEKQYKCLVARFIENKSAREIAKDEGVAHQVIDRRLESGIKKLEKYFAEFFRK